MNVPLPQPWPHLLATKTVDGVSLDAPPEREMVGQRVTIEVSGLDVDDVAAWVREGGELPPPKKGARGVAVYAYPKLEPGRWVEQGRGTKLWVPNPKRGIGVLTWVDLPRSGAACTAVLEGWIKMEGGKPVAQYRPGSDARLRRPRGVTRGPYVWVFREVKTSIQQTRR